MPRYNVDVPFWRHGELLPVNSEVTMTIGEAKYLGHAITEKKAFAEKVVTPEPAPAPAAEPEAETPTAFVAEVVEQRPHGHKRRRNAE